MSRSFLLIAGLAVLSAGCYVERPLTSVIPAPTTRIVAQITDTGSVALANTLGPGAREVEGVVVGADATQWDLQVIRVDYRGGNSTLWNRERVTFPRYSVTNASERTFNKKKSWLVAGLITGAALIAARLFGAIDFGGSDGGGTNPPN